MSWVFNCQGEMRRGSDVMASKIILFEFTEAQAREIYRCVQFIASAGDGPPRKGSAVAERARARRAILMKLARALSKTPDPAP